MITPVRLQLSRRPGFDLQAHSRAVNGLPATNCSRPGYWGNPFKIGETAELLADIGMTPPGETPRELAIRWYEAWLDGKPVGLDRAPPGEEQLRRLIGRNLACWCALDVPCHAGVLLRRVEALRARNLQ